MKIGFDTIGNACLICYDNGPILATDPWIEGGAYFGSWALSHEVPKTQRDAVLAAKFIWFSHGHPDHLNPDCLPLFKGKQILLADHVGGRIRRDLEKDGFNVQILPDRRWVTLSENIRVMCVADLGQDSVLLVDINGRLVLNTNDCGDNGWGKLARKIVQGYEKSFLMCLSGYGDTDMINFYDEKGRFIPPYAAKREPIGPAIAEAAHKFGVKYFVPFSSMHRYQRSDSIWANQYCAQLEDYEEGWSSDRCELLPAFLRYDCESDRYERLDPKPTPNHTLYPSAFGDNWSDPLEKQDVAAATSYFQAVEKLMLTLGFINLKVGGRDHVIPMGKGNARGVTFEAPRHSLMQAIQWQIFDDMLIGNVMKTTLHGPWPVTGLYPDFTPYLCKYADNASAKTLADVRAYFEAYERRSLEVRLDRLRRRAHDAVVDLLGRESVAFRAAKSLYHAPERFSSWTKSVTAKKKQAA